VPEADEAVPDPERSLLKRKRLLLMLAELLLNLGSPVP
jgi:hypothetical protein